MDWFLYDNDPYHERVKEPRHIWHETLCKNSPGLQDTARMHVNVADFVNQPLFTWFQCFVAVQLLAVKF